MATPPTANSAARMLELDDIEVADIRKPFEQNLLGQLPVELLETITECLGLRDLPAVARIHPTLCALAKRLLYPHVLIPYERSRYREDARGKELWPLCWTLSHRQDLADKIQVMDITVQDRELSIVVAGANILPGHSPFRSAVSATIEETCVAGMPLPRLSNLEALKMNLVHRKPYYRPYSFSDKIVEDLMPEAALIKGALGRLFSGFDTSTVHLVVPP